MDPAATYEPPIVTVIGTLEELTLSLIPKKRHGPPDAFRLGSHVTISF